MTKSNSSVSKKGRILDPFGQPGQLATGDLSVVSHGFAKHGELRNMFGQIYLQIICH